MEEDPIFGKKPRRITNTQGSRRASRTKLSTTLLLSIKPVFLFSAPMWPPLFRGVCSGANDRLVVLEAQAARLDAGLDAEALGLGDRLVVLEFQAACLDARLDAEALGLGDGLVVIPAQATRLDARLDLHDLLPFLVVVVCCSLPSYCEKVPRCDKKILDFLNFFSPWMLRD